VFRRIYEGVRKSMNCCDLDRFVNFFLKSLILLLVIRVNHNNLAVFVGSKLLVNFHN
jgi:hypothetical protein